MTVFARNAIRRSGLICFCMAFLCVGYLNAFGGLSKDVTNGINEDEQDYKIVDVSDKHAVVYEVKPLSDYDAMDPFDKDVIIRESHVIKKRGCYLKSLLYGYYLQNYYQRFVQPPTYYYYYYYTDNYNYNYNYFLTRQNPRRIRVNSLRKPQTQRRVQQTKPLKSAPVQKQQRQSYKSLPLERIPSTFLESGTKRTYALTPPEEAPKKSPRLRQFISQKSPQKRKVFG